MLEDLPCWHGSTRIVSPSLNSSRQMEQDSTVSFTLRYLRFGKDLTCSRLRPLVCSRKIKMRHWNTRSNIWDTQDLIRYCQQWLLRDHKLLTHKMVQKTTMAKTTAPMRVLANMTNNFSKLAYESSQRRSCQSEWLQHTQTHTMALGRSGCRIAHLVLPRTCCTRYSAAT